MFFLSAKKLAHPFQQRWCIAVRRLFIFLANENGADYIGDQCCYLLGDGASFFDNFFNES